MSTTEQETAIVSAQVPLHVRETLLREARDADRTLSAEIRRVLTAHTEAAPPKAAASA